MDPPFSSQVTFCYFPVNCESYVCDPQLNLSVFGTFVLWNVYGMYAIQHRLFKSSEPIGPLEPYASLLEAKGYVTSIYIWILAEFFKMLPLYTTTQWI